MYYHGNPRQNQIKSKVKAAGLTDDSATAKSPAQIMGEMVFKSTKAQKG